jgi:hypothetical protein
MTLGEKSGRSDNFLKWSDKLMSSAAVTGKKSEKTDENSCTFSDVVDKACEGLMDRQIKYSIRRIQEMEEILSGLEQELNVFLENKE